MKLFVTGVSGFLGKAIAKKLIEKGHLVIGMSRRPVPDMEKLGMTWLQGDFSEKEKLEEALKQVDAVFHVGAKTGIVGNYQSFYESNVEGTQNLLKASSHNKVPYFIFTSSPSIVIGENPLVGVDENIAPLRDHHTYYQKTKALAEEIVSKQSGNEGMKTVSLRPHMIYGPGDTNLTPRVIERGKKKRIVQIGDGKNEVDISYVDNVVHAHLLALDKLIEGASIGGKAYFISDGQPVKLWNWLNQFLSDLHLPPIKRKIPFFLAFFLGSLLEKFYRYFLPNKEPLLSRFLACQLGISHYFNIQLAKKELGYNPVVSQDEAFNRTIEFFKDR